MSNMVYGTIGDGSHGFFQIPTLGRRKPSTEMFLAALKSVRTLTNHHRQRLIITNHIRTLTGVSCFSSHTQRHRSSERVRCPKPVSSGALPCPTSSPVTSNVEHRVPSSKASVMNADHSIVLHTSHRPTHLGTSLDHLVAYRASGLAT